MRNQKQFANLLSAVEKLKSPSKSNDENFWKVEGDKAGNGFAKIRFLWPKTEDGKFFVRVYNHGFKNEAGKWFVAECPTTIGNDCPVCAANGVLWNSGLEANKEIVRKRKRKTSYIANVLVIEDRANPDNEGKVFLFKFGQKIFDKIMDKIAPPVDEKGNPIDPDEQPMNPFDPFEGANFKLKMRQVEGFANFDKSEFESQTAIGDDERVSELTNMLHDLDQFIDPKNFKSYEDLETKLNDFLGGSSTPSRKRQEQQKDEDKDEDDLTFLEQAGKQEKKQEQTPSPKKPTAPSTDDDDDDLSFFSNLAKDND